eukprot:m.11937 g.11937  ORF g.11937 m.11937 type:complete len:86 (-) comp6694_c0_seq1:109-366(-)
MESVVSCVLLMFLKALCEAIRECTLTAEGTEQLQVDVLFLHQSLAPFVYDDDIEGSVCALLAQAVNSTLRRTTSLPPPLLEAFNT